MYIVAGVSKCKFCFLGTFLNLKIFDLQLVEFVDVGPADMENLL